MFSGLPGVGKTTIARLLAQKAGAMLIRIDAIEHGVLRGGMPYDQLMGHGYLAGAELAVENLRLGFSVVADSVNPLEITRGWWREAAARVGARCVEIEVVCSDIEEHRRRVEGRSGDFAEYPLPTWDQVVNREFEPWPGEVLRLDSAVVLASDAVAMLLDFLQERDLAN